VYHFTITAAKRRRPLNALQNFTLTVQDVPGAAEKCDGSGGHRIG